MVGMDEVLGFVEYYALSYYMHVKSICTAYVLIIPKTTLILISKGKSFRRCSSEGGIRGFSMIE